ncbi:MAG: hypothetical protein KDA60_01250 [Planctomycetales bacterium]|nr:hypothetical protein [Planctomycetales bacterium]
MKRPRFRIFLLFAVFAALPLIAHAGDVNLYGPFTDDASTGLDPSKTYTHAISGGTASSINGLSLEALGPGVIPANFSWSTNGLSSNSVVCCRNEDWIPADGGVTGPGLIETLGSFTYSSSGDTNPASQTFVLSGLTPGYEYETQFFVRMWDTEGSGRPIELTFTNGSEVDVIPGSFLHADRAMDIGMPNAHSAYSLAYGFVAQGPELTIDALVDNDPGVVSGSFHVYALTNELIAVPEPTCGFMLGCGMLGLVALRRR